MCSFRTTGNTPSLNFQEKPTERRYIWVSSGTDSYVCLTQTATLAKREPRTSTYQFPDQDPLGDLFAGRWVALPCMHNALKIMRVPEVHGAILKEEEVKNIHYILSPNPWDTPHVMENVLLSKWWDTNNERVVVEKERGIDGFR